MRTIIAELSGNHGGNLETAKQMIRTAAAVGCDAVKFQLYRPEDLHDPDNNAIYEKCMVPSWWLPELFETAQYSRVKLFASVFAPWAVIELQAHPCWAYKLASPESTRLPHYETLHKAALATGKPIFLSSGKMDFWNIYKLAFDVLFYCKAGYPALIDEDDVKFFTDSMPTAKLNGFSDHTAGIVAPLAMIAAGATFVEKHFKLDDDCVDAAFSLNPDQMETLCKIAHR